MGLRCRSPDTQSMATPMLVPEDPPPLRPIVDVHRRGRRLRVGAWRVAGDLPASFRYAAQGLAYSFASQRNFRIHVVTGAIVFGLGLWLQLSVDRLAVLVLTVAAVLVLELLNTATEAVVDLAIGRQFHPLARIAKDCAAAAVLVAALDADRPAAPAPPPVPENRLLTGPPAPCSWFSTTTTASPSTSCNTWASWRQTTPWRAICRWCATTP
jgi:diacylglycerol kinase (ATP)